MAIRTQGTMLYAVDPADDSVITVGCVLNIDGVDTSIEQIETTCLDASARTYLAGLATPGTATFGINVDTSDASHVRLHQLKIAGTSLNWAIGWSEAITPPTVDSTGEFVITTDRSWLTFEGYMNAYPFSFAQNAVVTSSVGIQVSGEPTLTAAST